MTLHMKIYSSIKKKIFSINPRRESLDIFLSIVLVAGLYTFIHERNIIPRGLMNANLSAEVSAIVIWLVALGVLAFLMCLMIYLLKVGIRGLVSTYNLFRQRQFLVSLASLSSTAIAPICFYYCCKAMLTGKICPHGWECNPGFIENSYALSYVGTCATLMYLVWLVEKGKDAAN